MTQMIDTEGDRIPNDAEGRTYFDADLCDWNDGKGPYLAVNIPCFFDAGDGTEYDGNGVVIVPIQEVLEDYLKEFKETDDGDGVEKFAAWLRDYANRLESSNAKLPGSEAVRAE